MTSPLYCNANGLFFLLVGTTFVLCGLLHPQEITSLVHGFAYYMAIPTMYLILMIYAVCNLHVNSWGTREGEREDAEVQRSQSERWRSCVCCRNFCRGCEHCCCPSVQIVVDTQAMRVFNGSVEILPDANRHVSANGHSDGKRPRLFVGSFSVNECVIRRPATISMSSIRLNCL